MSSGHLSHVIQHIRRIAGPDNASDATDQHLLERFVAQHDNAAFAALVARHGPMVHRVCRQMIRDRHLAEDAFQATFLVLVRRAGRARATAARRGKHERQGEEMTDAKTICEPGLQDIVPVLHEELHRLPERYRSSLVLCYLEGKTRDEAAQILGRSPGAVKGTLERARELLRSRLTRRGIGITGGVLATVLAPQSVNAALLDATVGFGVLASAGQAAAGLGVSAQAIKLANGVMRTMILLKLKMAAVVVLTGLGLAGFCAGVSSHQFLHDEPTVANPAQNENLAPPVREPPPGPGAKDVAARDVEVPSQQEGVLLLIGTEIKQEAGVPAAQIITIKSGGISQKYRRLHVGDTVEDGQLLARLDDRLARAEVEIKKAKVKACQAELAAAEKTRDEAKERYEIQVKLQKNLGTSKEDVRGALLTFTRYVYEVASKQQAVVVVEQELRQAQTTLETHEIRSPVKGTVRFIYKQRGEAVKRFDPVFQIKPLE
jgi:DNA-directed RNA polymerase specialized sigma24 family protein